MFGAESGSAIMAATRGENPLDLQRKKQRPLSIIEEFHEDEDGGPGEVTTSLPVESGEVTLTTDKSRGTLFVPPRRHGSAVKRENSSQSGGYVPKKKSLSIGNSNRAFENDCDDDDEEEDSEDKNRLACTHNNGQVLLESKEIRGGDVLTVAGGAQPNVSGISAKDVGGLTNNNNNNGVWLNNNNNGIIIIDNNNIHNAIPSPQGSRKTRKKAITHNPYFYFSSEPELGTSVRESQRVSDLLNRNTEHAASTPRTHHHYSSTFNSFPSNLPYALQGFMNSSEDSPVLNSSDSLLPVVHKDACISVQNEASVGGDSSRYQGSVHSVRTSGSVLESDVSGSASLDQNGEAVSTCDERNRVVRLVERDRTTEISQSGAICVDGKKTTGISLSGTELSGNSTSRKPAPVAYKKATGIKISQSGTDLSVNNSGKTTSSTASNTPKSVDPLNHALPTSSGSENQNNQLDSSGNEADLNRLKATATKLNLKTRRPSYLTWRAKYVDKPRDSRPEVKVVAGGDGKLTQDRKDRMNNALGWIKKQLVDLRRQDQSLARQLLGIRHELSNLKLAVSCEEHQDLLEDAQEQIEELRELSRFADVPLEMLGSSPLRHIGVTKMNLSSRRFSTC